MDPRHDPRVRRAKREAAKHKAWGERGMATARRYDVLLESLEGVRCAAAVMGDEALGDPVKLLPLVHRHIERGFGLPSGIEAELKKWAEQADLSEPQDRVWWVMELLQVAVCGLRVGSRSFAWSLVEQWTQNQTLSGPQLQAAEFLLAEAGTN